MFLLFDCSAISWLYVLDQLVDDAIASISNSAKLSACSMLAAILV